MEALSGVRVTRSHRPSKKKATARQHCKMTDSQLPSDTSPCAQSGSPSDQMLEKILKRLDDLSCLPQQIQELNNTLTTDISELRNSLQFSQGQMEDMSNQQREQGKLIDNIKSELAEERTVTCKLQRRVQKLEDKLVTAETYSRKLNLIFGGLPEKDAEDPHALIHQLINDKMALSLDMYEIYKCHRLGKVAKERSRPLLARFVRLSVRDKVLRNGGCLKNTNVWVSEDVHADVKRKKSEVRWVANHAQKQGHRVKITGYGDACNIDGIKYTHETLATLPKGLSLSESKTLKVNSNTIAFQSKWSELSNLFPCLFKIEGVCYNSVEQYFQAQ